MIFFQIIPYLAELDQVRIVLDGMYHKNKIDQKS